ncbi:COX15/CtaA family protein [Alienimonas californiensis]|uniref:Heme A synthase n=1 Tax=Alienimonas californiensis TaxID=2527989 RepID=A0A517PE88_9PLAN|nr:COX15/CtaA family protein [Alienimonas californiensis]QDT17683.1 Heme A synthase [Alienimonas californiensis]
MIAASPTNVRGADAPSLAPQSPWPHRVAWLLVLCTVIGTVGLGATVTTLGAGMAFLDWPTSGGENMLAYNFFNDIKLGHTDKVLEHVHRLAGATTGLLAIALVASLWFLEPRRWVRGLGVAVLGMVIVQGLAGGLRVTEISTALAMLHGHFGACVVAAMFVAVLVTGRSWANSPRGRETPPVRTVQWLTGAALAVLVLQYALGGMVRHFGGALFEHLGGAVLVGLLAAAAGGAGLATGERFLRWNAAAVLGVLGGQLVLGMLAWATRFGVAAVGTVAVQHSPLQIISRGGHTVFAMLLLSALVCQWLRARRLATGVDSSETPPPPAARSVASSVSVNRLPTAAGVAS